MQLFVGFPPQSQAISGDQDLLGYVLSIMYLILAFWGKWVSNTTWIQALPSLTLCYSSLSEGFMSVFTSRLYAISCIMASSWFESLTD